MRLHLRVDVCTYAGLTRGVAPILEALKRAGARATFYIAMGPDRSGRAIFNLFRPGFLSKMIRSGAPGMYGYRTMLYGTLLPSPRIGTGHPDLLNRIRDEGHELGPHGWNHRQWQDRLDRLTPETVEEELRLQCEWFGGRLRTMAAPAWIVNGPALEMEDRLDLRFASDCRGRSPFVPAGRKTPQVPVTLPTLDEIVGLGTYPDDVLRAAKGQAFSCYCAHAESEGRAHREPFERFLERFDEVLPLGEAPLDDLPVSELNRGTLPGRSGEVCIQGGSIPERDGVAAPPPSGG